MSTHTSSDAIEKLARAGYTAKGVVYATVGVLAAATVIGIGGGEVGGTRNAIQEISTQPWGTALVLILVLGLLGYVLWRYTQGIKDTENKGSDASGWAQRLGFMISGTVYLSLAVYALSLTGWFTGSADSSGSTKRDAMGTIMSYDWGGYAIAAVGLGLIGVGVYQGYRAVSKKFKEQWRLDGVSDQIEAVTTRFAQFGIASRALTFLVTGSMIMHAGLTTEPDKAVGLGESLSVLREQAFGVWLLLGVGVGLVMYGIYCFMNAKYRTVRS